jgi:hypothetical protein
MIVLDANIRIRAVLGRRVRHLIDTYAAQGVRFFAPDVAFPDAKQYLPPFLAFLKARHGCGCAVAMKLTGLCWPRLSHWHVASGPKMRISLELVSQPGPQIASRFFSKSKQSQSNLTRNDSVLNGVYDFMLDCHAPFMERGDSVLTVLPEQLGPELKSQTASVEMLVKVPAPTGRP